MLLSWHLFNIAAFSLNHRLDTHAELGACLFYKRRRELGDYSADGGDQAGFGVVGGHVGDVLDIWPNEVVQWVRVRGGGQPVREGCKVVALLLKPSLGLFGFEAPSPGAIPRVCHRPSDCTRGSPHSSAHPGTLWCWLSSRLRRCEVAWCGPHLKPHQRP